MVIADKICKSFNDKVVLDNVSFHIKSGESVALIGLNGSGKSTLLKIIVGILAGDAGYIRVQGKEPEEVQDSLGIISSQYAHISTAGAIKEHFELNKKMYRISEEYYRYVMEYAGKRLDIGKIWEKEASDLSLGEKSKAKFLITLLIKPKLWIMDEPMVGVDYKTRLTMYDIISHFKQIDGLEDMTVLFVTHNMQEIEMFCEKVMVLHQGRIIFLGPIENLQSKYRTLGIIRFEIEEGYLAIQDMPVRRYKIDGNKAEILFDKDYVSAGRILKQVMETAEIKEVSITDIDMENMVKNIFK